MIENYDGAMENYMAALKLYADIPSHGKKSTPYLSTLLNLGLLFKDMAARSKGMDKAELLLRAEEAMTETFETRKELNGESLVVLYHSMSLRWRDLQGPTIRTRSPRKSAWRLSIEHKDILKRVS